MPRYKQKQQQGVNSSVGASQPADTPPTSSRSTMQPAGTGPQQMMNSYQGSGTQQQMMNGPRFGGIPMPPRPPGSGEIFIFVLFTVIYLLTILFYCYR